MDCCACFRAAPLSSASALVVRAEGRRRLPCESACGKIGSCATLRPAFDSQGLSKFHQNHSCASHRTPRGITVASAKSNECESGSVSMPLEPVTPEGRFLHGILKNQPHIFPVAAARQLEELANDRNSAIVRWAHSMGSEESYLHRTGSNLLSWAALFVMVHKQAKQPKPKASSSGLIKPKINSHRPTNSVDPLASNENRSLWPVRVLCYWKRLWAVNTGLKKPLFENKYEDFFHWVHVDPKTVHPGFFADCTVGFCINLTKPWWLPRMLISDPLQAMMDFAHEQHCRKIAEMKDCECQIAVEEVMYMLIVDKFSAIKVPMVPNLAKSIQYARLDISLSKDAELESIYDSEVVEMVREHLFNILEWKGKINLMGKLSMMHIKWVQLERIYAASIMYGYFIKSVSLRHQLELSLAQTDEDRHLGQLMNSDLFKTEQEEKLVALGCSFDMASSLHPNYDRRRVEKLKSYMMGFDTETLQICAQLRSQGAVNLIEKQSCALFEDCLKRAQKNDGNIIVTYSAFKRLVLEAVAFGSFLWDVERYVDSIYMLKAA